MLDRHGRAGDPGKCSQHPCTQLQVGQSSAAGRTLGPYTERTDLGLEAFFVKEIRGNSMIARE